MTPDCCPETRDRQQHITADISFASRQYVAVTGDEAWLVGENYGYPLEVTNFGVILLFDVQIYEDFFNWNRRILIVLLILRYSNNKMAVISPKANNFFRYSV